MTLMDVTPTPDWGSAAKLTKKRRLPIRIYRRIMDAFTSSALATGHKYGLTLDEYRRDRDGVNGEALDEIVKTQVDELHDMLIPRHGASHHLLPYLNDVWCGADQWRGNQRRVTNADEATARRTAATRARELSAELRRVADLADAVAFGLELRAEDYEHHQRVADFVDAVRGDITSSSRTDE